MASQKVGAWAFILGVVIAIVAGAVVTYAGISMTAQVSAYVSLVLVILGLVVGFLNVKDKEVVNFLIAAIALLAVGSANLGSIDTIIPTLGTLLNAIIAKVVAFVFPAALVVALKEVYNIAGSKL